MIEEALVRNKQYVTQFSKNSSVVKRLREEASNLTLALAREISIEIQRKVNQTHANQSRKFQNSFRSLIIDTRRK